MVPEPQDLGHRGVADPAEGPERQPKQFVQAVPDRAAVRHGYHDITFKDCVFEAADTFTLDIPSAIYNGEHTDGYVTVDGCTIYGGGVTKDYCPYGIAVEGVPEHVHGGVGDRDLVDGVEEERDGRREDDLPVPGKPDEAAVDRVRSVSHGIRRRGENKRQRAAAQGHIDAAVARNGKARE